MARIASLHYDPRVPVFVDTNRMDRDGNTNVFYLDLNRNRRFDESGFVLARDASGRTIPGQTNYVVGDPEWVGVSSRVNEVHSGTNRFPGRYAYIIIPAGRMLDINFFHNRVKPTPITQEGFNRNQGHGSWEINLAGFLADLNADQWGYVYNPSLNFPSSGRAFQDANELLQYRYNNWRLRTARNIFGGNALAFGFDGIDEYADGDNGGLDNDPVDTPWPGAPNPKHFFTIHDFFNPKSPSIAGFQGQLRNAGSSNDSYNAYTFYRMLAQLGTDSVQEKPSVTWDNQGRINTDARINLNYANTNEATAAEFRPWTAETFLQVVGDRLLREYGFADGGKPLSVTNLTVYRPVTSGSTPGWTNFYTPDVHRILQMTVNIWDAMTNKVGMPPFYPTVLKPQFENIGGEIKLVGYREMQQNEWGITNASNWLDRNDPAQLTNPKDKFIYGVPVLIGAKKWFPNFNEFVAQSDVQFERVLELWQTGNAKPPANLSQRFLIGVSNSFGLELWNSYASTSTYPRELKMFAGIELISTLTMTNLDNGSSVNVSTQSFQASVFTNYLANTWHGQEFRLPTGNFLWTNSVVVPWQVYSYQDRQLHPITYKAADTTFPQVQWTLQTTNRFRYFLFDNGYLVDAAGFEPGVINTNLYTAMSKVAQDYSLLWDPTPALGQNGLKSKTLSKGIVYQLGTSSGDPQADPRRAGYAWDDYGRIKNANEIAGFREFYRFGSNVQGQISVTNQAPFTPQVKICHRMSWRANDPLVHYMAEDLRRPEPTMVGGVLTNSVPQRTVFNLVKKNKEYAPWRPDGEDLSDDSAKARYVNLHITDPNIHRSDDWNFPTNKFPSIGWLGRVHRGTPWQTIYFKPAFAPKEWTDVAPNRSRAHPTNDWRLADIFTVAQHPNASRGRLSVNQTNEAAWSALFGGIEVTTLTNTPAGVAAARAIAQPIVVEPPVRQIVEAVNNYREKLPGKVFGRLSEFLAVPALTTNSPYLMAPYTTLPLPGPESPAMPLRDEDYERIPEAILSLVKPGEARFVIYAFGQSLKPAPQSVIPGGTYRGMCLNYEVTGEL
ncbi:MAG TPA: hypothetical protein VK615_07500, partial [Candidatus Binatia bacterium]|nr:hypothetical protein [Candidatus Binatia bacterium]